MNDSRDGKGYPALVRLSSRWWTAPLLFSGLLILVVFAGQAVAGETVPAGSKAVQEALWSPAELASKPEEKHGKRIDPPDVSPPAKTVPERELSPLPQALRGSIRSVDTGGVKLVALTFDLCELSTNVAGYDGAIVDDLRRAGISATFFAGGKWMRSHPERAMQLIADPLFEVGSHAWTHGNFGVLDTKRMREQLSWTQAQYEILRAEVAARAKAKGVPAAEIARIPESITTFRFPYGRCRPEALELLAGMGIAAVQWNVNSQDAGAGGTGESVARRVIAHAAPGAIVLCHANGFGHGTSEAVSEIVGKLRAQGYRFVTVSELLRSGKAVAKSECYADTPGDTEQYDAIFGDGTMHPKKK